MPWNPIYTVRQGCGTL